MRIAGVVGVLLLAAGCALPGHPSAKPAPQEHHGLLRVVAVTEEPTTGAACAPSLADGRGCGDGKTYRFDPAAVRTVTLRDVRAVRPVQTTAWAVELTADRPGSRELATLTSAAARSQGQLGLLDARGQVLSAPSVQEPIADGKLQVSGNFTHREADRLVRLLTQSPS